MANSVMTNGSAKVWSLHHQVIKRTRPKNRIWAYWFPILTFIFTVASFIAGYTIAVLRDDERAWFSYISDGGAIVPESCIFGILLNYGAFFWILTAFSIHIHLSQYMLFYNLKKAGWTISRWALLISGLASSLGLMVVANFQETNVPIAHGLGAWLAFFCGIFYVWLYIIISCVITPKFAPNCLTLFRGALALITTFSLVIHITATNSAVFVKEDSNGKHPPKPTLSSHDPLKLDPDNPVLLYANHLCATVSEWVLGLCFQVIVLTFGYELGSFTVTSLTDEQLSETTEDPELTNIKHFD